MHAIQGTTRVACVIGDPIGHSLSPAMHNAAFQKLGIDAVYVAFHVAPSELRRAVAGLRSLDVLGCNVTVPHKERLLPLLDSIGAGAQRTGAVNTIVNRKGHLHGENTDVVGFRRALDEAQVELAGARVLLLGAGGAARAVLTALREAKASTVIIANRTSRRAHQVASLLEKSRTAVEVSGLEDVCRDESAASIDLVINSTSVGLRGEAFLPLPYAAFPKHTVFYDLIPRAQTEFLRGAKQARRRALDGTGMLLHQGAAAFELWTQQPAPLAVMRKALEGRLRLQVSSSKPAPAKRPPI